MTNARSLAPAMTAILVANGAPAEMLATALMETDFLMDPNHDSRARNPSPRSSATGPWQFQDDTAASLGLRIVRLAPGSRVGSSCDERTDWRKSTAAAGRHFRDLLRMFNGDPLLSVLGYAAGPYAWIQREQGLRLNQAAQMGISYWAVRRYRMASNLTQWHPYVMRWAAAALIMADPRSYQFSLGSPRPLPGPLACSDRTS